MLYYSFLYPVISKIDNFLIPRGDDNNDEYIFYRFVPRVGQGIEGLKIITFDERANLLSSFEVHDIPENGILKINKGKLYWYYAVTHPIHGILTYHQPSGFLRAVNVGIVVGETRKVRVPIGESKKVSMIDYEVNRTSRSNSRYGYTNPTKCKRTLAVGQSTREAKTTP